MSAGTARNRVGSVVSAPAGLALAGALGAVAAIRQVKPLHAKGRTHVGTWVIERPGRTGVPILDQPGSRECTVRISQAMGIAPALPDIPGVAVRFSTGARNEDILFASTFTGRWSRYALRLRRPGEPAELTTLLPMRCAAGSFVLCLRPRGGGFEIALSVGGQEFSAIGRLEVAEAGPERAEVTFDPIGNTPVGARQFDAVVAVRAPAYALARRVTGRHP